MIPRGDARWYEGTTFRVLSALFGAFLAGVGVYAFTIGGESPLLRYALSLALVVFGANLIVAAVRAKPSWLSRIGPLP